MKQDNRDFNLIILDISCNKTYKKYIPIIDKNTEGREDIKKIEIRNKSIIFYTSNSIFQYPIIEYFTYESDFDRWLIKNIDKVTPYFENIILIIISILTLICGVMYYFWDYKGLIFPLSTMFIVYIGMFIYMKNSSYENEFKKLSYIQIIGFSIGISFVMLLIFVIVGITCASISLTIYLLN
ncbi:hypothetical protein [Streptococcus dysgalactiae]|uniref:hypothetical protein n=1 Tax=Streptococcus dysgalactiae TaxID=1334 RepID=UPI002FCC08A9